MLLVLIISLILAGAGQALTELITRNAVEWIRVFQIAVMAGVFGFLVCAWHERGIFYAILTAIMAAVAGGIFGRFMASRLLQILIILGVEFLFVGLIKLGDMLAGKRAGLRWLLGFCGAAVAGALTFGIAGVLIPEVGGFFKGIQSGLAVIAEISIAVPSALLVAKILLGEAKPRQPEKEDE